MTRSNEKVFVIINSYLVGDMLLVNSLVQNIKRIYHKKLSHNQKTSKNVRKYTFYF